MYPIEGSNIAVLQKSPDILLLQGLFAAVEVLYQMIQVILHSHGCMYACVRFDDVQR